jgi:predicted DNA-binding transcriptional regulator YafY
LASAAVQLTRDITPEEALVLQLAESHLKTLLPGHFNGLFGKLFAQARSSVQAGPQGHTRLSTWARKVRTAPEWLPRTAPKIRPMVHEAVSTALVNDQQLDITYFSRSQGKQQQATVSPLGVVQRGPILYLSTSFEPNQRVVALPMHRIERATLREEAARQPEGFALDTWVAEAMQFSQKGLIELVLLIDEGASFSLTEAPIATNQKIMADPSGRHRLTATVLRSQQLSWWLLGMAGAVEVVSPADLRQDIAKTLANASKKYGDVVQREAASTGHNDGAD